MKPARWPAWAWGPAFAGALGLLVVACVSDKAETPAAPLPMVSSALIAVETRPVFLDPGDPTRSVDGFRYAGGVAITSDQTSRLHGLSDLLVTADGGLIAPSDDGDLFKARLVLDGAGRLTGLSDATLRPLRDADGQPLQGKAEGDAEGIVQLADGPLLISFERKHRIWTFAGDTAGREAAMMPTVELAENDGFEGLAAFGPKDRQAYWVGAEPGDIWLCGLKMSCEPAYGLPRPPAGFRLSGLAGGPDGELVILHHSYIPAIGSRIQVTVVRDPWGAKTVIGKFSLPASPVVDNFEGVAVTPGRNGDWRLYLLSDDNFSPTQRTLLLAFDWTPPK